MSVNNQQLKVFLSQSQGHRSWPRTDGYKHSTIEFAISFRGNIQTVQEEASHRKKPDLSLEFREKKEVIQDKVVYLWMSGF